MVNANPTSGSPLWQTVFLSFGAVLILFEIVRGYRQGLPRQLVRLLALLVAYAMAYGCGPLLVPLFRPLLRMPDVVISPIAGALLAMLIYLVISTTGRLLLKPTRAHESGSVRVVYGLSGGAVGVIFGLFFIWLILVGIRSVGSVADAQLHARVSNHAPLALPEDANSTDRNASSASKLSNDSAALPSLLARVKNSIELGGVGNVLKQTDVLPAGAYQTLGKLGDVFAQPQSVQRFADFPGVRDLGEQPKIKALRDDPKIARMVQEGRYLELLHDPRLIEALNDHALLEKVKKFDLSRALDSARGKDR